MEAGSLLNIEKRIEIKRKCTTGEGNTYLLRDITRGAAVYKRIERGI